MLRIVDGDFSHGRKLPSRKFEICAIGDKNKLGQWKIQIRTKASELDTTQRSGRPPQRRQHAKHPRPLPRSRGHASRGKRKGPARAGPGSLFLQGRTRLRSIRAPAPRSRAGRVEDRVWLYPQRRSSNANRLWLRDSAESPEICALGSADLSASCAFPAKSSQFCPLTSTFSEAHIRVRRLTDRDFTQQTERFTRCHLFHP